MSSDVRLLGFSATHCSRSAHYSFACLGILLCFLPPELCLDALHARAAFANPSILVFLRFSGAALFCSPTLSRILTSRRPLHVPVRLHLLLAAVLTASAYLGHFAAFKLSSSTELLFKSPQLIPVILANFVFLKRPLRASEILLACILVAGFIGIAIGDFSERGDYDTAGIVAALSSLLLEAGAASFEEYLLIDCGVSTEELIAVAAGAGSLFGFIAAALSGDLALVKLGTPQSLVYVCVYAVMAAIGLHFVFFSLALFGSIQTVLFTSFRKVVSSVGAVMLSGGVQVAPWYRASVAVVSIGMVWNFYAQMARTSEKPTIGVFDTGGIEEVEMEIEEEFILV
jgi:drug/metabolite transporter (DMT)-like permease